MKKKILIDGMSCSHCVKHVKEALGEIDGVTGVNVDLDSNSAVLEAAVVVSDDAIKFAIDDAGYEVTGIEVL